MSQFNPLLESLAQIHIHEFESETEWIYYELQVSMGNDALESMVRNLEIDVIKWREFCAPGTRDVDHAYLIVLSDALESDTSLEEQKELKKSIQATLHWMRINGTLVG